MKKVTKNTDVVNNTKRAASTREFLRAKAESYVDDEPDEMAAAFSVEVRTKNERRITSSYLRAMSVFTSELGFSDKSKVLLTVLMGLSDGQGGFEAKYETIYCNLRKYDSTLRDENGQLSELARQTVRRYIEALKTNQERAGVVCARIERGHKEGQSKIPTWVELPLLDYLDEINRRTREKGSYTKKSKTIREQEARKFAVELSGKDRQGTGVNPKSEFEKQRELMRKVKRAVGTLSSTIADLQAQDYTDEAIRKWIVRELLKKRQQDRKAFLETITLLAELPNEINGFLESLSSLLPITDDQSDAHQKKVDFDTEESS